MPYKSLYVKLNENVAYFLVAATVNLSIEHTIDLYMS